MVIRQFELNKHRKSESVMNKSIVFADYQNMIANVGNLIREQIEVTILAHRIPLLYNFCRKDMSCIERTWKHIKSAIVKKQLKRRWTKKLPFERS